MVFWFFKKRDDGIKHINTKLHNSFSNLKKDMGGIYSWIEHFKQEHNSHKIHHKKHYGNHNNLTKELQVFREEMKEIRQFLFKHKIHKEETETPQIEQTTQDQTIPNLTTSQKTVMKRIYTMLKEEGVEWIPMKDLTQDLYPTTKYDDVKSMMSIYTDLFLNFGLVNKKRKGKETLISLTEKSKNLLKDSKKELKQKTKNKNKNS